MSTTVYNTFSITISYGKNFGAPFDNQINFRRLHRPGLTPACGLRRAKVTIGNRFGYLHIQQYSKGAKTLAPFEYNMERTEYVPKGDFGFLKFGCLQLKVRDEKNLPVLKTTSGSTKILVYLKIS